MFLLIRMLRRHSIRHWPQFTFHNVSINTTFCLNSTRAVLSFTFHNVSINTYSAGLITSFFSHLHSTMFLLIQWFTCFLYDTTGKFTFHNVSINTYLVAPGTSVLLNLHSTMFLLIRYAETYWHIKIVIYIPQCFY